MARIEVARGAVEDLDRLIATLSLPTDTRERVRRSLRPLVGFPRVGAELTGRWEGLHFVLGSWRWMLLVYELQEADDRIVVLTAQDARSSSAANER